LRNHYVVLLDAVVACGHTVEVDIEIVEGLQVVVHLLGQVWQLLDMLHDVNDALHLLLGVRVLEGFVHVCEKDMVNIFIQLAPWNMQ